MSHTGDSRVHKPAPLRAGLREEASDAGSRLVLLAPAVGLWRDAPPPGSLVQAGTSLGRLEILGELHELLAPAGAHGVVLAGDGDAPARRAVGFDDRLLVLDPQAATDAARPAAGAGASAAAGEHGLVVRAPSSGRFYRRPGPDKPAFVAVDQVIREGQVVGLLEVMKTFTRVSYGGDLPSPARVLALLADDEADVAAGQPLIAVEPAPE